MSEQSPEARRSLEGHYLILHRENYLEEPSGVREAMAECAAQLSDTALSAVLDTPDWRSKLVGIYCVIAGRRTAFIPGLRDGFLASPFRLVRRPACLGLTIFDAAGSRKEFASLLDQPFSPDALDDYAAALEGMHVARDARYGNYLGVVRNAVERADLDIGDLERSQQRFASAVRFWQ